MSGLTLLHPLFAWLLPLAGLPVLFHFFLRVRKRSRPFSTLMFFHRIDPRMSSRRRLREWLILLLRCLLLFFFLLALARPVWRAAGGRGRLGIVMVIDNSASMRRPAGDGRSRLDRAVEACRAMVASLRPGDTAGLALLVPDAAVSLPETMSADRALLRAALDQVRPTDASGAPAAALERAVLLLGNPPVPRGLVHVLSDLQRTEWNRLPASLPRPGPGTSIFVHRLAGDGEEVNAGLLGVERAARELVAGRRARAEAVLRAAGGGFAHVRLQTRDDAGGLSSEAVTLAADEERRVGLALRTDTPGVHWTEVWIEGDDFEGDNRAALVYRVRPRQEVLLLGGRADYGLLPAALSPGGEGELTGLVPRFVDPADAGADRFGPDTRLVACTWDRLAGLLAAGGGTGDALRAYVEAGGNLLLLPAPGASAPVDGLPGWLGAGAGPAEEAEAGAPLRAFTRSDPVLDGLLNAAGEVNLAGARAARWQPLRLAPAWTALAGLENGVPLLAASRAGAGRIFASGMAFDPAWTTLTLKGAFVALAHNMALAAGAADAGLAAVVAGNRPPRLPGAGAGAAVGLRTLAGVPLAWQGEEEARPVLPRAGVYELSGGGHTLYAAASADPAEGPALYVGDAPVPALGDLRHEVLPFGGGEQLVETTTRSRRSLDTYLPLLLAALLCLLAEGWLANAPPRRAGRTARPAPAAGAAGAEAAP